MQNTGPKEKITYFGYFFVKNLNKIRIKNTIKPIDKA